MYKPRNHFICIDLQQKPSQRVKQALRFSSASLCISPIKWKTKAVLCHVFSFFRGSPVNMFSHSDEGCVI